MEQYTGPERRKMDNLELMIGTIRDLFNQKMDTLEKRIDKMEEDTKEGIEKVGARVENMINIYEMRSRHQGEELIAEVEKLKKRVFELEQAPLKKAAEVQKGFWKNGQEVFIKGFWVAGLGFVAFLILKYIQEMK